MEKHINFPIFKKLGYLLPINAGNIFLFGKTGPIDGALHRFSGFLFLGTEALCFVSTRCLRFASVRYITFQVCALKRTQTNGHEKAPFFLTISDCCSATGHVRLSGPIFALTLSL